MKKEGLLSRFIIFCHRNSILYQWKSSSELIGLKLEDLENQRSQEHFINEADGWIVTYQGATKKLLTLNSDLTKWVHEDILSIADEAHHLGVNPHEPESQVWGKTFLHLTSSSKIRLGLTGTPFRTDNLAFCAAKRIRINQGNELIEVINPDLSVEPRELIAAGDIRPLEFHFQDGLIEHRTKEKYNVETSPLSTEQREIWRARNLRRAIKLTDTSSIAMQLLIKSRNKLEKIRQIHPNAAALVIAKDIDHAIGIANFLKEDGGRVELVHSFNKDAGRQLASFQKNDSNWLVSVDMCSEGFDAPRIRVIAYLSTVVTKSRFIQAITRAVRISQQRSSLEPIPRNSSHVFAPADPLLMDYARSWSTAKPYLIQGNETIAASGINTGEPKGPTLPMEAINDRAGKLIKFGTTQLPNFLKG